MTERRLEPALQAFRQHLAHQQREHRGPCPCHACRDNFEFRMSLIMAAVLGAVCTFSFWWWS